MQSPSSRSKEGTRVLRQARGAALVLSQRRRGRDGLRSLDQAEGPNALQEAVDRAQHARGGEAQDVPAAALLKRVGHQHRRDCEETEGGEGVEVQGGPHRQVLDGEKTNSRCLSIQTAQGTSSHSDNVARLTARALGGGGPMMFAT